jgi:hypothetical protein
LPVTRLLRQRHESSFTGIGPSPAFADGILYAAYTKAQTELVTRTFEIAPGDFFTVTDMPQPGASDLVFLDHVVGRDLTFEGLAVTPSNPAPGQAATVTAMLRNDGDLAVAAPQVTFYDGPNAIATVTLPDTLGGGHSVPVAVAWTVPVTPEASHFLRAEADPNDTGDEPTGSKSACVPHQPSGRAAYPHQCLVQRWRD